ncbi:Uncharacterised protein [Bacteroides heparinolyticus]|uniref:Outer membrane protein beta-barrel domain-containing protein n=2 Tax=Prevotella heparinolytica TaxID=28113 RepID=A0A449HZT8_9BACE|nr:Uncharacterised protein [Bacteroides heparinolyticus]
MNKMSLRLVFVCLVWSIYPLYSSAQSKINIMLDYHYLMGVSEIGEFNLSRKESKMYGNSLHFSVLYNISTQISAGVGVGADRYDNPDYNTFPIFAAIHYAPIKKIREAYTYTNIGYAVIDKNDTYSGRMWDIGIGYKKMFRTHLGVNFQIGYNLKQLEKIERTRHSLSFGVGLIF